MTPLARWVLLATLFGHAMSVPTRTQASQDACVVLCSAENVAVNEDKVHVIPQRQFVEGRRGHAADRLLSLCLERSQHSTICKVLIKSLRQHRRCDCELIENSRVFQPTHVSFSLLEDLIKDFVDVSPAVESKLREIETTNYRSGSMRKVREKVSKRQSIIGRETEKDVGTRAIMETGVRYRSSATNSFESGDDISASMETWCIAQCDIGHGGSACDCDILP